MKDERNINDATSSLRGRHVATFFSISTGLVAAVLGACQSDIVVIGELGGNGGGAVGTGVVVTSGKSAQSVAATVGVSTAFVASSGQGDACDTAFVPTSVSQVATAANAASGGGTCVRDTTDGNGTRFESECDDVGCDCKNVDTTTTVCHCLLDPPGDCSGVTCCPAPWAATP